MRNNLHFGLALALGMALCGKPVLAQQTAQSYVVAEHRYLFTCQGVTSDQIEKKLTEALRGIDAEMVVSIDRPAQLMKLVARFPLNVQEVVGLAAQYGANITPRREIVQRDGTYGQQD